MIDIRVNTIDFDKKLVVKSLKGLFDFLLNNAWYSVCVIVLAIVAVNATYIFTNLSYLVFVLIYYLIMRLMTKVEGYKTGYSFPIVFKGYFNPRFLEFLLNYVQLIICGVFFIAHFWGVWVREETLNDYILRKLNLESIAIYSIEIVILITVLEMLFTILFKGTGRLQGIGLLMFLGAMCYLSVCRAETGDKKVVQYINEMSEKNAKVLFNHTCTINVLWVLIVLLSVILLPPILSIFIFGITPIFIGIYLRELFYSIFDSGIKEKKKEEKVALKGQLAEA